jgi:phosphoribosylformylglycinamidine (FGAM) synthase-like enzyme
MTYRKGMGAKLSLSVAAKNSAEIFTYLFGEDQARYVLAVKPKQVKELEKLAGAQGITLTTLGHTQKTTLDVEGVCSIATSEISAQHESWLPKYMSKI